MWPLYLPAPATIRMGIRALKMCKLSLFFSLNFTAFVSAKLGRNEFMKIAMPRTFLLHLGFLRFQLFLPAYQLLISCQTSFPQCSL